MNIQQWFKVLMPGLSCRWLRFTDHTFNKAQFWPPIASKVTCAILRLLVKAPVIAQY